VQVKKEHLLLHANLHAIDISWHEKQMYLPCNSKNNHKIEKNIFTVIIKEQHFKTDYLMTTLLSESFSINADTS
jgi:hypothetical protein